MIVSRSMSERGVNLKVHHAAVGLTRSRPVSREPQGSGSSFLAARPFCY